MANYPQVIEAGNEGNGAPLTLGDPNRRGDLFVQNGYIAVADTAEGCLPWTGRIQSLAFVPATSTHGRLEFDLTGAT